MKTYSFILVAVALFVCETSFSQESNRGEDYSAYLPEIRTFNKLIGSMPPSGSLLTREGIEASRKGMTAFIPKTTIVKPVIKTIAGPAGNISLRIFRPDTVRAVILDIHGGGWFQGVAASDDALNDAMAQACHAAIVSVEYRLAPENPFPACIDDCKAAAKWLVGHAQSEFGTSKLFITGQSAGGHLSALVAIYIRDSLNAISMVRGVCLQYGCFNLGRSPSQRQATDSTLILSKNNMAQNFTLVFSGWSTDKLTQPQYSPLYADLKGLPPAFFIVGTSDPLLDDTNFMESRWRSAGNKTFLGVYPECPHGFNIFPTKLAKAVNERMFNWVNGLIGQ